MSHKHHSKDARKNAPKRRLGRGLNSLINGPASPALSREVPQPDTPPARGAGEPGQAGAHVAGEPASDVPGQEAVGQIAIEQIATNPHQPRQNFDPEALEELAQSIRQQGILQPLIVTNAPADLAVDRPFVLIAGERRLRAAQQAGRRPGG